MKRLFFALVAVCLVISNCKTQQSTMINKTTVNTFDLNKYLGTWYEIARFQHSFEKNLVGVTANYTLRDDGKVNVLNQGYKDSLTGLLKSARGKAKVIGTGRLKVSFFWFFYAEYNVLELDTLNYQWALIGSSNAKYLWILCRKPQMDANTYMQLVEKAKERGYDISKLHKVLQKADAL